MTVPQESPPKKPPRKRFIRKNTNSPPEVRAKMASPEMTAKRMEGLRKWKEANGRHPSRMQGQPDGVGIKAFRIIKAKAEETAAKAIRIMADKKIWVAENDVAERAMQTAIEIMESTVGPTQHRLSAAKTILEFTQTKPVVKSESTIKSAEAFLEALMQEDTDGVKP
jgi:hypothetical protein